MMIFEHLSRRKNEAFDPDKFVPIENESYRSLKPKHGTGLWACPVSLYPRNQFVTLNSFGVEARRFDESVVMSSFLFELATDANLLVVKEKPDLSGLPIKANPYDSYDMTRASKTDYPGLDWELLAEEHDAVLVDYPIIGENCFWGWDVPSLIVLQASAVAVADSVEIDTLQFAE